MAKQTGTERTYSPTIGAKSMVAGTYADLIVDGYDQSESWMLGWRKTWTELDTAFLIGRGWSATKERWQRITDSGIPIMAINDVPDCFTPRMWCTGDPPGYFRRDIWLNPSVVKFCPLVHAGAFIPRLSAYGAENQITAMKCPNVHFFHKSVNHDPRYFLDTPWIDWGTMSFGKNTPNCAGQRGARSSMFAGLRILAHLGFKNILMLGVDCTPHEHPYPQYYTELFAQLAKIRPVFESRGIQVLNCNPDSHLRVFDFVTFDEAVIPQAAEPELAQKPTAIDPIIVQQPPETPTRKYIVTMDTGGFITPNVSASHKAYAKRCGAEYIVFSEPWVKTLGGKDHFTAKLHLDSLPIQKPCRVLWLDCDVIVRYDCESLFDLVPVGHFGAVPNNQPYAQVKRSVVLANQCASAMCKQIGNGETFEYKDYFNGGVMLFDLPDHAKMWEWARRCSAFHKSMDPMEEQTLQNIARRHCNIPLTLLDCTYNRLGDPAWKRGAMGFKIQHLARIGKGQGNRNAMLKSIRWKVAQRAKAK